MLLKLDYREKKLIERCKQYISSNSSDKLKDIVISTENLLLGDAVINHNEEDIVIIERKTVSDLLSSIKDGRYKEQSYRLSNSLIPNHRILYLIEGIIQTDSVDTISRQIAYSSIVSLMFSKGFSVFKTTNVSESACLLCNMCLKMMKPVFKLYNNLITDLSGGFNIAPINETSVESYQNVVKACKKDNLTPNNIGVIMLSQIPNVSTVTAQCIINKYETIPILISALEKDNQCLKDITYETSSGQTRKISKTVVSNIPKFLSVKTNEN